jgi:thioredoxin-dependent peroxiredoxin
MRKLFIWLVAGLLLGGSGWPLTARAQAPVSSQNPMALQPGQPAPDFAATDVFRQPVSLTALRGHRVLLSFMRNAGCPVCNLRVHELQQKADSLRAANTVVILVYESTAERMREYLVGETLPLTFIADPEQALYARYGVETSTLKFLRSMSNGVIAKGKAGTALAHKPLAKQDGNTTRIEADFLIDERGILEKVHYGRFVGDHLPL